MAVAAGCSDDEDDAWADSVPARRATTVVFEGQTRAVELAPVAAAELGKRLSPEAPASRQPLKRPRRQSGAQQPETETAATRFPAEAFSVFGGSVPSAPSAALPPAPASSPPPSPAAAAPPPAVAAATPAAPVAAAAPREPWLPDDTWADTAPARASPSGSVACPRSRRPAQARAPAGTCPELEDDSWADGAVDGRSAAAPLEVEAARPVAEARGSTASAGACPGLPLEYCAFAGRVLEVHASDVGAADRYAEVFSQQRFEEVFPELAGMPLLVGLDFEWKPDRRPGDDHPIALIQLACWDSVLIVRTTGCSSLPAWLSGFLEDEGMWKLVMAFDVSDKKKLNSSFGWDFDSRAKASSYVDVAEMARKRDIPHGMLKMSQFFKVPMLKLKSVGKSNWARAGSLDSHQRSYAADDAFFQLYLVGKVLEHGQAGGTSQTSGAIDPVEKTTLKVWRATLGQMSEVLQFVDYRRYRDSFSRLRGVVADALNALSKALGWTGSTCINDLIRVKGVQQTLAKLHKKSGVSLDTHFLRHNSDVFVVFYKGTEVRVRLRAPTGDDDDVQGADIDLEVPEQATDCFQSELLELLAAYEPPIGDRPTVFGRNVPEAFWVPAKAVLDRRQEAVLEKCMDRLDSVEASYSDTDGWLLRMTRHPRAPDDAAHMDSSAKDLQKALGVDQAEARRRLNRDVKYMQWWGTLRILEAGGWQEQMVVRTFQARVRILTDSQSLADRCSPPAASWEAARDALDSCKWYRTLLGPWIDEATPEATAALEAALDELVAAWPDTASVKGPKTKKSGGENTGKGKSNGKGKGKGKGKAKSKK